MTLKKMTLNFAAQYAGCSKGKDNLGTFGYGPFLMDDIELFKFKKIMIKFRIGQHNKANIILSPRHIKKQKIKKEIKYFKSRRYTNLNMRLLERRRFFKFYNRMH